VLEIKLGKHEDCLKSLELQHEDGITRQNHSDITIVHPRTLISFLRNFYKLRSNHFSTLTNFRDDVRFIVVS